MRKNSNLNTCFKKVQNKKILASIVFDFFKFSSSLLLEFGLNLSTNRLYCLILMGEVDITYCKLDNNLLNYKTNSELKSIKLVQLKNKRFY